MMLAPSRRSLAALSSQRRWRPRRRDAGARRPGPRPRVLARRLRHHETRGTRRGAPASRIAIIDTGVDGEPAEFAGAVVGGTDVSGIGSPDGRTPVGAVDANHGSWVASLAGRPRHGRRQRA